MQRRFPDKTDPSWDEARKDYVTRPPPIYVVYVPPWNLKPLAFAAEIENWKARVVENPRTQVLMAAHCAQLPRDFNSPIASADHTARIVTLAGVRYPPWDWRSWHLTLGPMAELYARWHGYSAEALEHHSLAHSLASVLVLAAVPLVLVPLVWYCIACAIMPRVLSSLRLPTSEPIRSSMLNVLIAWLRWIPSLLASAFSIVSGMLLLEYLRDRPRSVWLKISRNESSQEEDSRGSTCPLT